MTQKPCYRSHILAIDGTLLGQLEVCLRASFERLVYPSGCNKKEISARRSIRDSSNEGQPTPYALVNV